ncbi:MAG: hypothetical protein AAFQ82_02050 [Myxococcota bacterium]
MPLTVFALVLAPCAVVGLGDETDGIAVGLELGGHFGIGPSELERTGEAVSFGTLGPPVDELALSLGSTVDILRSELAIRAGLGFAAGNATSTSASSNEVSYRALRIPLGLAWRAALLDGKTHPLLGLDLGVMWTSLRYEGAFEADTGLSLGFFARALAGVDVETGDGGRLRAFLQYRLDPSLAVVGGPDLDGGHLGFGFAYVFSWSRPAAVEPPGLDRFTTEGPERSVEPTGLDVAFDWIRQADALARAGNALEAESAYARGVAALPTDPTTRANVELPVRRDWAKQLVRIGRKDDAVEVLREGLRIAPRDRKTLRALERLGASTESVPAREEREHDPVRPNSR